MSQSSQVVVDALTGRPVGLEAAQPLCDDVSIDKIPPPPIFDH